MAKRMKVDRETWRRRVAEIMVSNREQRNVDPNHEIPSIFRIGRLLRYEGRTELQAEKEREASLPMDFFE